MGDLTVNSNFFQTTFCWTSSILKVNRHVGDKLLLYYIKNRSAKLQKYYKQINISWIFFLKNREIHFSLLIQALKVPTQEPWLVTSSMNSSFALSILIPVTSASHTFTLSKGMVKLSLIIFILLSVYWEKLFSKHFNNFSFVNYFRNRIIKI